MSMQRYFLLFVAVATAAVMPAMGQTLSAAGPAGSETHGAASIPDFSRVWTHPAFPWFEPPASGPGPITNLSRWAGRFGGFASQRSRCEQLRPTGRGLPKSDPAAVGGSGGQAIRRNLACRH